jgi:tetratricopeptide (TPR) repeat protein
MSQQNSWTSGEEMTDQEKRNSGSLTSAGRRGLVPTAAGNLLVARGLADIVDNPRALSKSLSLLQDALSCFFRGTERYQKFDYYKAHDELANAIRLFDQVIEVNPTDVFARRHRAKAYWWYGIALELPDRNVRSKDNLPSDYYLEMAMREFDRAILLAPNDALVYVERGTAWCGWNSFKKGIDDMAEAVRINPDNPGWYALRGVRWLEDNESDKAIQDLTAASRLTGQDKADVLINFTAMQGLESRCEDSDYGSYPNPTGSPSVRINLFKNLAIAYSERGYASLSKKQYHEAIQDYSEAIRLGSQRDHYFCMRGIARTFSKEHDRALEDLTEAIRLSPTDPSAHGSRARVWLAKGEYEKAISDCNQAIELEAEMCAAPLLPVWHMIRQHMAVGIPSENWRRRLVRTWRLENPSYYITRGSAWFEQGCYSKAMADFEKAIRLDPQVRDPENAAEIARG